MDHKRVQKTSSWLLGPLTLLGFYAARQVHGLAETDLSRVQLLLGLNMLTPFTLIGPGEVKVDHTDFDPKL